MRARRASGFQKVSSPAWLVATHSERYPVARAWRMADGEQSRMVTGWAGSSTRSWRVYRVTQPVASLPWL